jgi:hypothetical protein
MAEDGYHDPEVLAIGAKLDEHFKSGPALAYAEEREAADAEAAAEHDAKVARFIELLTSAAEHVATEKAAGDLIAEADGVYTLVKHCHLCGQQNLIEFEEGEYDRFVAMRAIGARVRDAFPDKSADWCEAIISGSHAECFDAAFADD